MLRHYGLYPGLACLFASAFAAPPSQRPIPYSHAAADRAEAPFRFHGPNLLPASMAIRGDSVVIGGTFYGADGILAKSILVWDGRQWTDGYPGIPYGIRGIRFAGDRLYAAGFFTLGTEWPSHRVAVWDPAKGGWEYLGGAFDLQVSPSLLVFLGDTLLVAGRNGVQRWTGSGWTPFGKGYQGEPSRMEVFDGKLWLSGDFEQDSTVGNLMVWEDGAWKTPAGTLLAPVTDIVWHKGSIFMIEQFVRGTNHFRLSHSAGGAWVEVTESTHPYYLVHLASNGQELYLTGVTLHSLALQRWNGTGFEVINVSHGQGGGNQGFLAFTRDGTLIQAANLCAIGRKRMDFLSAWDGTSWNALTQGGPLGINAPPATLFSDGTRLFVASMALELAGDGNLVVNAVTAWDGAAWDSLDGGLRDPEDFRYAEVLAFGKGTDGIYAGGTFLASRRGPARHVARWDGARWHPLRGGFPGVVKAFLTHGQGMYVAGRSDDTAHASSDALPADQAVGFWNGNAWSVPGTGLSGEVRALAEFQGEIHAAGRFRILPAGPVCGIAKLTEAGWMPLPRAASGEDSVLTDSVYALAVFKDRLYAMGRQTTDTFPWKEALLAWDGRQWERMEDIMQGYALLSDSNALYAGFTNFQGNRPTEASGYVRAARYDGHRWLLLPASAAYSDIRCMALHGDYLYVGGSLSAFNGKAAAWLGRWNLQGLDSLPTSVRQGRKVENGTARGAGRYFRLKDGASWQALRGSDAFGLDGRWRPGRVPKAAKADILKSSGNEAK